MKKKWMKQGKGSFACLLALFCLLPVLLQPVQAAPTYVLTEEEESYVAIKKTITVAAFDGFQPIVYQDGSDGEYKGMAIDCLTKFSERTGLAIVYKEAENYLDAIRMVENGQADLTVALASYEGSLNSYRMSATRPYLSAQMLILHSRSANLRNLPSFDMANVNGCPEVSKNPKIRYMNFDTPEDCLQAIRTGHADIMACDLYTGMAYMQKYENRDLQAIPASMKAEFSFGVSEGAHPMLEHLLEEEYSTMSRGALTDSLTHNRKDPISDLGDFVYTYPFEIICIVLAAAFLTVLVVWVWARIKSRRNIAQHGYETSYRLLADAQGEAGLSYDYMEDRMTTFGGHTDRLAMPKVIERFSRYLEEEDRKISLTREEFYHLLRKGMLGEAYDADLRCVTDEGNWQHFRFIFSVISTSGAYQRPIRMVGCLVNVENEYQENQRLQQMGLYDGLTALYNRAGGQEKIEEHRKNSGQSAQDVLLIVDVDRFKQFNDTFGHACGDDVLATVGRQIKQLFWTEDILCRWGGDEFLLYLVGAARRLDRIDEKHAELRKRMRAYQYAGEPLPVTLSIGGTVLGDRSFEEAFEEADKALYQVKKRGRDAMHIHQ